MRPQKSQRSEQINAENVLAFWSPLLLSTLFQLEHTAQSYVSSDPEDCDMMQDCLEDRKYPGEVTTPTFKVKFQPKDSKKELLS